MKMPISALFSIVSEADPGVCEFYEVPLYPMKMFSFLLKIVQVGFLLLSIQKFLLTAEKI